MNEHHGFQVGMVPTYDERPLHHHQLPSSMRLRTFGLPGGNSRSVQAVAISSYETTDNELGKRKGAALKGGTDDHDRRSQKDGLSATQSVSDPDA